MNAPEALKQVWHGLGLDADAPGRVAFAGDEPVLPSSFAVDRAAAVSIAAAALAAAEIDRARNGRVQGVSVAFAHAAAEFRSERLFRIDGAKAGELWDPIAGAYRSGDGSWLRLHTNFAHHRDGVLALLGCANSREAVAAALARWKAEDFEEAATARGLVVALMRTAAEWAAHPHAAVLAAEPFVAIEKIGDAPAEALAPAARPLGGVRVLDLTRIIAGPVAGRALAAHGADVLRVIAPGLSTMAALDIDSGRGKRSAHVDLATDAGRRSLTALMAGADIVVQSYRPGALARRGFGPEDAARLRPGIVHASLSAYGEKGPWAGKRGFDSLVQTVAGFNADEAEAAGETAPRPLPCQALDHASGYLLAAGALAALGRRAREGGSWRVHVSLARTAAWLRALGRVPGGLATKEPDAAATLPFLETTPSGFGALTAVRHAGVLAETPPFWARPSMPYGTDAPAWAPRAA